MRLGGEGNFESYRFLGEYYDGKAHAINNLSRGTPGTVTGVLGCCFTEPANRHQQTEFYGKAKENFGIGKK